MKSLLIAALFLGAGLAASATVTNEVHAIVELESESAAEAVKFLDMVGVGDPEDTVEVRLAEFGHAKLQAALVELTAAYSNALNEAIVDQFRKSLSNDVPVKVKN